MLHRMPGPAVLRVQCVSSQCPDQISQKLGVCILLQATGQSRLMVTTRSVRRAGAMRSRLGEHDDLLVRGVLDAVHQRVQQPHRRVTDVLRPVLAGQVRLAAGREYQACTTRRETLSCGCKLLKPTTLVYAGSHAEGGHTVVIHGGTSRRIPGQEGGSTHRR